MLGLVDDAGDLHAEEVEPIRDALLEDPGEPGISASEELVDLAERTAVGGRGGRNLA